MIKAELTKNYKTIGKLEDDYVYLLNNVKHIMQDRPNGIFVDDDKKKDEMVDTVDKQRYKQTFSGCKKLRTFIKPVVRRKIKLRLEQGYYNVVAEYGNIMNASEISNSDDTKSDVWNDCNPEKVPDTKLTKYIKKLTDNDRKLIMSNNFF